MHGQQNIKICYVMFQCNVLQRAVLRFVLTRNVHALWQMASAVNASWMAEQTCKSHNTGYT